MTPRRTAFLLILAAVLANVAFTALGSIFNYPDVLDEPAGEVLAAFSDHEGAVRGWFTVLALAAGLLAPIAIGVGRLTPARPMRLAVWVGITAATVQVVGTSRGLTPPRSRASSRTSWPPAMFRVSGWMPVTVPSPRSRRLRTPESTTRS